MAELNWPVGENMHFRIDFDKLSVSAQNELKQFVQVALIAGGHEVNTSMVDVFIRARRLADDAQPTSPLELFDESLLARRAAT